MKFLEKIKSRRLSKTLAALAVGGVLIFGGTAANVSAAPSDNAMWSFKEAYLSSTTESRPFQGTALLFGTTYHAETNALGQILRDGSIRMNGNINWEFTNPDTDQTSNSNIPIYIEQANGTMTLYAQRNNRWSRLPLPTFPAELANVITTRDVNVLQENLNAVKAVELFKEDSSQRIFNVTLDGKYIANFFPQPAMPAEDDAMAVQKMTDTIFQRNFNKALQNTDVVCTWVFDKVTNQTATVSFNLTDLMRAYVSNVFSESEQGKIVIGDEDRHILETLGYFSELHLSATYQSMNLINNINSPAGVGNAVLNQNVFNDIRNDLAYTSRK